MSPTVMENCDLLQASLPLPKYITIQSPLTMVQSLSRLIEILFQDLFKDNHFLISLSGKYVNSELLAAVFFQVLIAYIPSTNKMLAHTKFSINI